MSRRYSLRCSRACTDFAQKYIIFVKTCGFSFKNVDFSSENMDCPSKSIYVVYIICMHARHVHAPLIATENPQGNLTTTAGQKRCFAKLSGSKNPIGPSPRLIIPGRRDASAVGYEFSVAKFFESKPRSRFFGSPARARTRARAFFGSFLSQ